MKEIISEEVKNEDLHTIIELVKSPKCNNLSSVNTGRSDIWFQPNESKVVHCRIDPVNFDKRTAVIFEPYTETNLMMLDINPTLTKMKKGIQRKVAITITNNSASNIRLPAKSDIGSLQQVASITPVEVKAKETKKTTDASQESIAGEESTKKCISNWHDESPSLCEDEVEEAIQEDTDAKYKILFDNHLDLDNLDESEKELVKAEFWEEREAFAVDKNEIGCADDLEMNIPTEDETPVQRNYNSIPRPLMDEVRIHVEDLLNRQWITQSKSPWSSRVVLV